MTVNFYSCNEPNNKLTKNIGSVVFSANCSPYGSINSMSPQIVLDYNSAIHNVNYAYVDTFGKYYFVHPDTITTGGRMIISLTNDVLMSNRAEILSSTATAVRWSGGTTDIDDSKYPVSDDCYVEGILFNGTTFSQTGFNYIMGVNG